MYDNTEPPAKLFQTKLLNSCGNSQLWNKAITSKEEEREKFYVDALMPPVQVCGTETGRNFRRLSSIPGRERSFVGDKVPDDAKVRSLTEQN